MTIENIGTEESEVEVTVSHPGGRYLLENKIAAGKTKVISINNLQQSLEPDF